MDLTEYILEPLRKQEEFILYRGRHQNPDQTDQPSVLLMAPIPRHPASSELRHHGHENPFKSELEAASELRPISVAQYDGQAVLVFENPGDELMDTLVRSSKAIGLFLRIALKRALEGISCPDDPLSGENRIVHDRVDQKAQLLSEHQRLAREFDQRIAERARELVETNEDMQIQAGLLQHLPVSAWTLKPDGTPDYVNRVWLEFSGQTLDFVRSHPDSWMTVVHPEDRESASKAFWDGVRSGQGFSFETRSLRARDGAYRWHLQQAVVLRDAEGRVLKFVGTTTDIHEQKLAEERVRASEANLRQVIDTIPTLSWCNLADGPNEFLSKSWHDYTGLSPEEAHGWGWSSAFHPDDMTPLMNRWQELLVSGESGEIEARLRRHDGVYRWFLIRVAPFRDKSGTILRWYGTSTDIHDRKLAEDALKRSEARYRVVIETASDAVVSVDESGTIILANPATNRMFGYCPEELIGRKLNILMPGRMRGRFETGFKRFLETGARNHNQLARN
jgi:PAS domain S-box-containing protein